MTPMAAFSLPFRLYRRREIIPSGENMKSILIGGVSLLVTSLASMPAQAGTIGITYSFAGGLAGPPTLNGTMLTLHGLSNGSILSGNPSLNALWNPVAVQDQLVVDTTTGLGNGTFSMTFANGDMLSGNLFENVSGVLPTNAGPFTQTYTFTGGTGMFAGASGSLSGAGLVGPTGSLSSGSGSLSAAGVSAPEPSSIALIFGGLLAMAASRKLVRQGP
jgi:hypothetical protein